MCSDMQNGCYEIREGIVYYCQSTVNIMKILEQILEHNDLLNKCIKENIFKIRAIAKELVPEKIETIESNEENGKDQKIKVKNNNKGKN